MRVLFSPEILQAGAVKGLIVMPCFERGVSRVPFYRTGSADGAALVSLWTAAVTVTHSLSADVGKKLQFFSFLL